MEGTAPPQAGPTREEGNHVRKDLYATDFSEEAGKRWTTLKG
jgi:hypothetical protein